MAATATAPRTRRAPARAPGKARPKARTRGAATHKPRARAAARPKARSQRRGITPAAGFAIPAAAVGRTAVAVGGIADSGLVVRLTRSRLWIGLVGALLVGIVGLNVYSLSLSATGSQVAQKADELALENSSLRAQLTERLSAEEIQHTAGKLGLANPMPDDIRYLRATDADAKVAAKRLLGGDLAAGAATTDSAQAAAAEAEVAPAPVEPAPIEPVPVATEPAAPAPVDPAATVTPTAPVAP
ncbi:MAG TPA: hypothetical protein VFY99_09010 [Solirubrobacterales bacterium]